MKIQVIEKYIFTDQYERTHTQHHYFYEFNNIETAIHWYEKILETDLELAEPSVLNMEGEVKIVIDNKTALWNDFPVLSKFLSDFNIK